MINEKMTPEQFVYWLQGYLEIADPKTIDEKTLTIIKQHISYVFSKGHLQTGTTITVSDGGSSAPGTGALVGQALPFQSYVC